MVSYSQLGCTKSLVHTIVKTHIPYKKFGALGEGFGQAEGSYCSPLGLWPEGRRSSSSGTSQPQGMGPIARGTSRSMELLPLSTVLPQGA